VKFPLIRKGFNICYGVKLFMSVWSLLAFDIGHHFVCPPTKVLILFLK
jgi:hypothetical protein